MGERPSSGSGTVGLRGAEPAAAALQAPPECGGRSGRRAGTSQGRAAKRSIRSVWPETISVSRGPTLVSGWA